MQRSKYCGFITVSTTPGYIIELYLQDIDILAALAFANEVGHHFFRKI